MGEVVPFMVMVAMEGCTIGLTIFAKTAITNGMSPFVFVVYTNALASLLLLPFTFIFRCRDRTERPFFTFPLLLRFFFLGLTGITIGQNLAFLGLSYSSPILVCAMGLLLPAFSFILSLMLRRTKLDWRSSSFQAKIIGTLISIMGALMVELYKGPVILKTSVSSSYFLQSKQQLLIFSSALEHWALGGILLAATSLSVSVWNVIQFETVKQYPEVMMEVVSFYSLLGSVQCAIVSLLVEKNLSAWKLKLNMELLLIVLTAVLGGLVRTGVHIWCMQIKGPFYVPMFKPFRILFATIFGISFFTNSIHYGSVIGAIIIGIGNYGVMWGQITEDEVPEDNDAETVDSLKKKIPLLQEETQV
ncbi:LOW QUALITY PROTEIN: WAT1-related protein At1g70260 [Corylus avellana]|uniref:LOW QUALITY PROTEIN: WAT1-related protein At1g70260 n=1 Tax=Corylus avellana TaxID=13451 RepID=UPI00286D16DA|nr:LOW QUALITY PROTEIN: WAT1-related protein At1g70260 [Corylus avellana]